MGIAIALFGLATPGTAAAAHIKVQCPGDTNGNAVLDAGETPDPAYPRAVCKHVGGGDGYSRMADGKVFYMFGYSELTGHPESMAMHHGMLAGQNPAPTIDLDEMDQFFLTLTNVGMTMRPDLFDPHSIHWHGYSQAASVFDGVPESSVVINMGASMTYFYQVNEPGTYIWHCHVEATEHMEMGMLGSLYVRPRQDRLADGTQLGQWTHHNPDSNVDYAFSDDPLVGDTYVYNDGDGTTRYDVEFVLQSSGLDSYFHEQHIAVQPLPFAGLDDDYSYFNGRGYPDSVNVTYDPALVENGFFNSQPLDALVEAPAGSRILLRMSNVSITTFFTVSVLGIPMTVVGKDAQLLRSPSGENLYYNTSSVTMGGGETYDVILDTAGYAPGTYFIYTTNLNYLTDGASRDFGGMMTEILLY